MFPGIVDPHVHFALPVGDRTTSDDFAAGSRAALFGGVTTAIDFSTPSPAMSLSDSIRSRIHERRFSRIDMAIHGTICGWSDSMATDIEAAIADGVTSFKFFTTYEESGRRTTYGELEAAARCLADLGVIMTVHAEDSTVIQASTPEDDSFKRYESSRPEAAEAEAISRMAYIADSIDIGIYIVHLSSRLGYEAAAGSKLMLETCPHYLLLDRSRFDRPDGFRHALAPPLRSNESQSVLWDGLISGRIKTIGTDHCVFAPETYQAAGDHYRMTPYGLPGVETSLPLMVTHGVKTGRMSWSVLADRMSTGPAKVFGLWPEKGEIRVGAHADLVILDPTHQRSVDPVALHSRTDWNPYTGMTLFGWPEIVLLRGRIAIASGRCYLEPGAGCYLPRCITHDADRSL